MLEHTKVQQGPTRHRGEFRFLHALAWLMFLALAWVAPALAQGTITVNVPDAQVFNAAGPCQSGTRSYGTANFVPTVTGVYTFTATSSSGLGGDPYGYIYTGSFVPANSNTNFLTCNDDSAGGLLPQMTATLNAGQTYVIMTTSFSSNAGGGSTTYSISAAIPPGTPVAPVASVPDVAGQASVAITAPAPGGSAITSYQILSSLGGTYTVAPSSPALINGLPGGSPVSFQVRAINSSGAGPYSPASNVVLIRAANTLSSPAINATWGDPPQTVAYTSNSPAAPMLSSSDPTIASVSGLDVSFVDVGSATLSLTQPAVDGFTSRTIAIPVTLVAADPALSWIAAFSQTFGDAPLALAAPTSASDGTFTYASSDPTVATVSGDTVSITGAGTTTLTATQAPSADGRYLGASIDVVMSVDAAVPVISWTGPLTRTFGDADFALDAPTSSSPAAFTYASDNPLVATVSGSTVTIVGAGTATLTASQPATDDYEAGSVTATLTVGQAAPTLAWMAPITRTFGDADFALDAATSDSSGAFTYSSSNPLVATVSGNTVTIVGAGSATLVADQAADANYVAGQASTSLTVSVADPGLVGFADINKVFGDAAFVLVPPSSPSAGAFTYSSANPAVATISGDTVTIVGAGTSVITATQAADGNYAGSSVTATLTVSQAAPTITWVASLARTFGDPAFALPLPASNSTGAFSYSSSNPAVATVSGNMVTIVAAGTATLVADQAADTNYIAGQASTVLTVAVADPGLSGFADINKTFGDAAFAIVPPSSASAGAFTYASANPAVATISGDTVTIVGAGTSVITATQAADGNYLGASISATLAVAQDAPAISWVASLNRTFGDAAFALPLPTSNSTAAFSYSSDNPAVATVSGNTVTIVSAGVANITASQAADANYVAGSATLALTVGKAAPDLGWIADIFKTYGEADFDLADPTSASPGAFTFTSSVTTVATVSGRTVAITGSGATVLTASQAETANYSAASVTTTLRVDSRPDPTQDPGVVAGLQAQVDASVRFVSAQQTNIRDRLRQVRSGDNGSSNALSLNMSNGFGPGLSLNAGQAVGGDAMPLPEGWGWWTAGAITFGDRDASLNSSSFDFQTDGISLGLDRRVGENAVLGLSFGTGWSDADFDADSSSLGGKHKSLALYGLWRNELVYLDGVLGTGRLDFDIRRYSALVNDYATANRDGDQAFASLTVGHERQEGGLRLATYGRFDASRTELEAYRESGLGIYDLSYTDQRIDSSSVSLGAEGGAAWTTNTGAVRPYWLLEYRMSLKDQSDVGINYVVLPNASDYLLRLRSYADDAFVWGGGLDFDIGRQWGLALLYRGERVSGIGNSYSVGMQLSWKGSQSSAPVTADASEASDAPAPVKGSTQSLTQTR